MSSSQHSVSPRVCVNIVTWNSESTICYALRSLHQLKGYTPGDSFSITVWDNASNDRTVERIKGEFPDSVSLIESSENLGFAEAHNKMLQASLDSNDIQIVMNPDLALEPLALSFLCDALINDPSAGSACPKLLRANDDLSPIVPAVIDAVGMYITPAIRHFDRGAEELDSGQYDHDEYVFGGSGALLALKRDFIKELSVDCTPDAFEVFDADFFAYREDADLAWRGQRLGWRCRYVHRAIGHHVRRVTPERRAELSSSINRLGVKNRFLLQLKNITFADNSWCLLPMIARNTLVLGAICTVEPTSLPALSDLSKLFSTFLTKRRNTLAKKSHSVKKWFSRSPYSEAIMHSDTPIKSIEAVIVNYNSGFALEKSLNAIATASKALEETLSIHTTVIDNASADASAARLDAYYRDNPQIDFLICSENHGFAGGINKVAQRTNSDALLVLNPDVLLDAGALRLLVEQLNQSPDTGVISPVLVGEDGNPQYGFLARRLPSISSTILELLGLHKVFPNNPWTNSYLLRDDNTLRNAVESASREPYFVEQPAGACMLIRRDAFEGLQGFDTDFHPAWYEDVDFCKRIAHAGWTLAVLPAARVTHFGGCSLNHLGEKGFVRAYFPNWYRYWMKHGSLAEKMLFAVFFRLGLLMRALTKVARGQRQVAKHLAVVALAPTQVKNAISLGKKLSTLLNGPRAALRHVRYAVTSKKIPVENSIAIPRQGSLQFAEAKASSEELGLSFNGSGICLSIDSARAENEDRTHFDLTEASSLLSLSLEEIEQLPSVHEASLDFLIAPRIFERIANPLKALERWCSKMKPGGTLYLTVSDKIDTDDASRAHTTLEHLIQDYLEPSAERTFEHYLDRSTVVDKKEGEAAISHARALQKEQIPIALHPMTSKELEDVVDWFSGNVSPLVRLEGPTKDSSTAEIHLSLRVGGPLQ